MGAPPKNPMAAALGRRGGRARGRKGLAAMPPEERRRIAGLAVAARRSKAKAEDGLTPGKAEPTSEYEGALRLALTHHPYVADSLEAEVAVGPDGTAVVTRTYLGIRPQPRRTVREILFRDASTRVEDGGLLTSVVQVLQVPDGVEHEEHSVRVGPWRETRILFPGGWTTRKGRGLEVRSQTIIPGAYRLSDDEDQHLALGTADGALGQRVSHPTRSLILRMRFPNGWCPAEWLQPWAWWGDSRALRASEDLLERGVCRAWAWRGEGPSGMLVVTDPLPGYLYALRWRAHLERRAP